MPTNQEIIEFGPFRLNAAERLLQRDGVAVELGSRSLDVLIALVERAGEVLSRRELIARAWSGLVVDEANLRVTVANLRKCLGEDGARSRYIVNVPGRGYSFVGAITRVSSEPAVEHSLPEKPGRIVGREAAIAELIELLRHHRFVSIVGPGGMGKTTVALAVAHEMLGAFDGAVYFVDLASLTNASLVPGVLASVLGLKVQSADPMPSINGFLAGRPTLLVLDNCEHLIEQVASLAERLHKSVSHTHVLATSRESLRVQGEHVHVLEPLATPPTGELAASDVIAFPAVQLFIDRAAASGAREPLTDEMAPIAGEICRRLDGIALAIELVAGRVAAHGMAGTARLLNSRFKLLWQGRRGALPRHQTLQAMLDWSYNLLSETERRVLYRLTVFVGPFDLKAAQWIASNGSLDEAAVLAAIDSLVDKSMLSPSTLNGSSYLRLLDTTRTYASAKLSAAGENHSVSRRLVEYLIADMNHGDRGALADRFAVQVGHVRAGLTWAFAEGGDDALGVQLAALAAPLFLEMSLLQECHHWCELALARLGTQAGSLTHLALQEAHAISVMFTRGNGGEVKASIEQGLRLALALGDHQRELALLAGMHIFLTRIGDFHGAVEVGRRGIELAQQIDSAEGIVMSEWMVGCAFHLLGDQTGALRHCEEAFKQAAARGVTKVGMFGYGHRTRALIVLARTLWLTGSVDRAVQVARQAVAEAEQTEQPVNKCIAHIYSATVFLWRGDAAEAETLINRLIEHATRYSLAPYLAVGIALSGEVALLKGDCRTAVDKLREALGVLYSERHHVITTSLSRTLAEALLQCGEVVEAEAMISAALERAEAQHEVFDMPDLLRTRAQIGIASGHVDLQAAEALLLRSIEVAEKQFARSLALRSTTALSELLARSGRVEEAHARLAAAYDRFTEGHDTRDLRLARQLLETWGPVATGVAVND